MNAWKQLSGVLLLGLSVIGVAKADQLDDIQQKGVLKVAVPQDFPPFGSVGADMQPHGYDIDMAGYLAQKLNVKLELVPVTSANRIPYLQTKKVDLVISSLGKNPEREKVIDAATKALDGMNAIVSTGELIEKLYDTGCLKVPEQK